MLKPPKDVNELAAYVVAISTGSGDKLSPPVVDAQMQALSKLGASKGGKTRAKNLTAKKRTQIAKKAAQTRWSKKKQA